MNSELATGLCEEQNSVLLVIDVQTQLTSAMPIKVLARLHRNISLLVKASTQLKIPVMVSELQPGDIGKTELDVARLFADDTRLYSKTCFSCLGAENFLDNLNALGRKQVILAGIEAHISVLQTAIQLRAEGFQVFVVSDAVCSRQRESYETGLQRLKQSGVIVCDAESVLYEWLRDTGNEQFSAIQSLMK